MTGSTSRGPALACTCRGCARRPYAWGAVWNGAQILAGCAYAGSHYFEPDARRFFRSRILEFRPVRRLTDEVHAFPAGAMVRESKAAGPELSDGREHVVTVWCPFGTMVARVMAAATVEHVTPEHYTGADYAGPGGGPYGHGMDAGPVFRDGRAASRWMNSDTGRAFARAVLDRCECHGCILDRATCDGSLVTDGNACGSMS